MHRFFSTDKRNLVRQSVKSIRRDNAPVKKNQRPNIKQFTGVRDAPAAVRQRPMQLPDEPENPKALDVAVVGRPNAGKSSLLNKLLDNKVSAVSPKYNTTRDQVLGIRTRNEIQMSFYDTPGIVDASERHRYVRTLATSANEAVSFVDLTMLVVDAVKRIDNEAVKAMEDVVTTSLLANAPIMLILNKVDLSGSDEKLNRTAERLGDMIDTLWENSTTKNETCGSRGRVGQPFYAISALRGNGIPSLISDLENLSTPRSWAHHSSAISDLSDLDLVEEIIREKLYHRFHQDLPYQLTQENRGWTPFQDGSLRIDQDILVGADRLKRMVIGTKGESVRTVGIEARRDIEKLLKRRVHLYLNVKTSKRIME